MNAGRIGARTIDVQTFIDEQRFSFFHCVLFVLCFLIVGFDGFDTGAMGFIAPTLVDDWRVSRESLGPVLSATLVGVGVGALLVSPLADRVGRKAVLVCSVFFFGMLSCASTLANSMETLTALRFFTGLGLGAAVPNTVTLMSEYVPARIRGFVVNAMFMGFAAGIAAGGMLSAWIIPIFGWRSVLLVGGVLPLLLGCVLLFALPESVKFMVSTGRPRELVAQILRRLAPRAELGDCVFICEARSPAQLKRPSPVAQVLSKDYLLGTTMLWLSYFMCLTVFYLLTNWLPTLFKASGFSLRESAVTSSLFHVGGCAGILLAGWLMDRFSEIRVVAFFYVLTALIVFLIGCNVAHDASLTALIVVTGTALSGAAASMAPLAAQYYPTTSRVTGVAWMLAVGRIGAVVGAFGGAILMGLSWAFASIFSLLAIPALIAALALVVLGRRARVIGRDVDAVAPAAVSSH
ncbi:MULTISPECIES: MFS transporter [unclassified Paraburkholderia]|uniref:MFS transporter n=1 Tax=unclassified Paraburkholderia TaxID=2615204 RepID=UPI002AB2397C|nr:MULTISPECIES: MFS transporter [unclassified Paraburkholderia]